MLKQGMIERFRKAAPIIRELVDDLAWIQNEFNPEKATEEERTYVKHSNFAHPKQACNNAQQGNVTP